MYHKYVPTLEEQRKMEEYKLRVKVFDELKIKYQNGGIDTLDKLKFFLTKHYKRIPLTFFTLHDYLESVENEPLKNVRTWTGNKYVYPLEEKFNNIVENERDRTLRKTRDGILRSNSGDIDNSIKYITRAVKNGYVSENLKTKLQGMYAFVNDNRNNSLSSTHIELSLQSHRLV